MAFSRNLQINTTVFGAVSQTSLQTSAAFNGVTFTFDRPMPVGEFATGDPFVVSDQPFSIIGISPASSDIEGDGYVGNGAMKNAYVDNAMQGFDGYLGDYPQKTTYETPYEASMNVDPGVSGSIPVASGETVSVTKSVRDTAKTDKSDQFQTISKYVTLTVLDTPPPVDSYMPGTAGTTKRIRSRADVDFTPRNIALPASWPAVSTILSEVPNDLGFYVGGERHRFFRVDNALGTTNDGYSAEIVDHYARYVYAVNSSDVSASQRQQMVDRIVTFANQIEATLDQGGNANFGAGQGGGLWLWGVAAAALLRDDTLHQKFRLAAAPDRVCKWVTSTDIGALAGGKSGVAAQTYFDEHLGLPWVQPDETGSHHEARYSETAAFIAAWELVSVLAFNQGPPGFANGHEMILNGGANDSSNPFAAAINFVPRWFTWNLDTTSQVGPSGALKDAFEDVVAADGLAVWSGQPEQYPAGQPGYAFDDVLFSAGNGQITFSEPSGMDYATEDITSRDFRYSLDGVQWVEVSGVSIPHTESGLIRGAPHWCSARRSSASGTAPWSGTFPYAQPLSSGSHRNRKTPSGSLSNVAPSYAGGTAPAICTRRYPAWTYPVWEETSATLTADEVTLAAGVGYPSAGFPAPTYTFQWQRSDNGSSGWSNIATGAEYQRTAFDAEKFLRCQITATNSSGSATATTGVVECPALTSLPVGTLIDTDFSGAFAVDYEAEIVGATSSNFTINHLPTYAISGISSDVGALYFDKSGANPSANVPLSRSASPSTEYAITAEVVLQGDTSSNRGDFFVEIVEVGGAVLFSESYDGAVLTADSSYDALWSIAGTFSTGSLTDIAVRVRWNNGTGGSAGGDIGLSRITIVAT